MVISFEYPAPLFQHCSGNGMVLVHVIGEHQIYISIHSQHAEINVYLYIYRCVNIIISLLSFATHRINLRLGNTSAANHGSAVHGYIES